MDLIDIVRKLAGPIRPIGATDEDSVRYTNLQTMIELTDQLLSDIGDISRLRKRPEASISRAGKLADEFFIDLGINEEAGT